LVALVADLRQHLVIDIRPRTIFKVAAVLALLWCLLHLVGIILLLVVAVILAVALDGPVSFLEGRNLSRAAASMLVSGAILLTVVVFLWLTWSSLTRQWQYLTYQLATVADDVGRRVPQWIFPSLQNKDWASALEPYALGVGQSIVAALMLIALGFFVTIYLLIDGRRTLAWMVAFFPGDLREKVARTLAESRDVIVAYARGNMLTSIFAAVWVLIWMLVLHVPAALLLAVIAGIADFIPVLGFVASAIPALALALTVSPRTALITLVLWVIYHAIENYFVAPWAYGRRLKLSDLAVILAFVVGAQLAGVIGALIALPIAALYPTVERIWLREQLPAETVREHRALSRAGSSKLRS
jgi:putative permease